jgi:hypothetical protein
MSSAIRSRGLALAALAFAAFLAGCQSAAQQAAEAEAARVAAEIAARTPPPIRLNQEVAEAASIYVAFSRDMAAIQAGFNNPESIQDAVRRGAAYDPVQLSRGLVAYASIVALQSPEFVAGVRQYAVNPTSREQLAANIVADPRWAGQLPGADAAAGLIIATLRTDIDALNRTASAIEDDAYAIQADGRRSWAAATVPNRVGRLEDAKARSLRTMLPSGPEAARLLAAAHDGTGLGLASDRRRQGPYPPVVERALAIAALAALGEAGDNAMARTSALQNESVSQNCLAESKLNLFQCLAAARPNYEDVFCLGRHIVRDIATCTRGAAQPAPVALVSGIEVVPEPRIAPAPASELSAPAPTPTPVPPATPRPVPTPVTPVTPPAPSPTTTPAQSATERLNRSPG